MKRTDASALPTGRNGFSLVEIAMVIIILGLISTVVLPPVVESVKQQRRSMARASILSVRNAVLGWAIQEDALPTNAQLATIVSTNDRWGNAYTYVVPTDLVADTEDPAGTDNICRETGSTLDNVTIAGGTVVNDVAFLLVSNGEDGTMDIKTAPNYDVSDPDDDLVQYVSLNQLKGMIGCSFSNGTSGGDSDDSDSAALPDDATMTMDFDTVDGGTVSSAQGFTGTLYGNVSQTEGKTGNGLEFTGEDDYVQIASNATLNNLTTNGTLMCWIYPTTAIPGWAGLIHKGQDTTNDGYGVFSDETYSLQFWGGNDPSDDRICILARDEVDGINENKYYITADTVVPKNEWTHVAGVWDPTGMRIYYNAEQVKYVNYTPVCRPSNGALQIGSQGDASEGTTYTFIGIIDGVGVYNRTVTAPELSAYYELTKDGGL